MLRSFDTTLELAADGREVVGRILPLGTRTHIRETGPDGNLDEYEEEFLPGCTERMRQTARARGGHPAWIRLTLDHGQTEDARIGYCTALHEADGGVDAVFRLHADPWRLDKVRSMLAESHTGLSVEFEDVAKPTITGTLRQRRQIHIGAVSATPIPVYPSARIYAVRADELELGGTPHLDAVRAFLADV